jgi:nitrogen fixation/metabolism regulation signal transduction histidine kinase
MVRWFDNLKLQVKFVAPIVALVIIGLIGASIILLNVARIYAVARDLLREQQKVTHVQAGLIALINQELEEKNYLLTGDQAIASTHTELNSEAVFHFQTAQSFARDATDRAAIQKFLDEMHRYHDTFLQMVALYEAGDRAGATRITLEISDPALAQTHREVEAIIDEGKAWSEQQTMRVQQMRQTAIVINLIGLGLFMGVGILVSRLARRTVEPILLVTHTAVAVEAENYNVDGLTAVAQRSDELGSLARVFQRMAREVYRREQQLKREMQQLRIEIDEVKRAQEVSQITGSDYFQELQRKARELRQRSHDEPDQPVG